MFALRFGEARSDGLSLGVREGAEDERERPFQSKEDDADKDKSNQSFDEDEAAG